MDPDPYDRTPRTPASTTVNASGCVDQDGLVARYASQLGVSDVTDCASLVSHVRMAGGCDAELQGHDGQVKDICCATCEGSSGSSGSTTNATTSGSGKDSC